MSYPDFKEGFYLETDASNEALAGVLFQLVDCKRKTISFFAKTLNTAERKYSATEKEAYAIVAEVKYFHHYLFGKEFVVRTDHACLRYLKGCADSKNPRLQRWSLSLQGYSYKVDYIKRIDNVEADYLTRKCDFEVLSVMEMEPPDVYYDVPLREYLENPNCFIHESDHERVTKRARRYKLKDEKLWYDKFGKLLLVPAPEQRNDILKLTHQRTGHANFEVLFGKVLLNFYWPHVYENCREFVQCCPICQKINYDVKKKLDPKKMGTPELFKRFSIDTLLISQGGLLPDIILAVAVEHLTKWTITKILPDRQGFTMASFIYSEIITRFGAPYSILTDNGREFVNQNVEALLTSVHTEHRKSSPKHPQSHGLVEVTNREILRRLRKARLEFPAADIGRLIEFITFQMNCCPKKLTPSQILEIQNDELPDSRLDQIDYLNYLREYVRNETNEDLDKTYEAAEFKNGQNVLLRNFYKKTKLDPTYIGPYRIVKKCYGGCYIIQDDENGVTKVAHYDNLKKWNQRLDGGI